MRDVNRIDPFLAKLGEYWKMVPDWRFGQFISNVFGFIAYNKGRDIFFPEEDEMIQLIAEFFKEENEN